MQSGTTGASGDPQSFFEEFVGELFDKLGCATESHPPVGKGFADYLAITPDGEMFYIEATAVRPTQLSEARVTEDDVCRKLDEICNTPYVYWFTATASGELYQYLAKRSLGPIKRWIEELSSEDPSPQSACFEFPSGDPPKEENVPSREWKVQIYARPRSKAKRGIPDRLLAGFGRGGGVDSETHLVRAARGKVKQHKGVSKPLLLAINDLSDFPSDRIDISMALFGWEQSAETGVSRITPPPGYERRRSIWGTQENRTVSAILLFHNLLPHSISYSEVCLYENPWVRHPIPTWLKESFPRAGIEEVDGIKFLHWPLEQRLSSVLGLPPGERPYAALERALNDSMPRFFRR